jgi:hypothetical protein
MSPIRTQNSLRNLLALTLVLGSHLLVALHWLHERHPHLRALPEVVSIAILLGPATRPAPRRSIPLSTSSTSVQHVDRVPRAVAKTSQVLEPKFEPHTSSIAQPAATDMDTPSAQTETADSSAALTSDQLPPTFSIELAKRQAALIGREERRGESVVSREKSTPWTRFRRELDAAYVGATTGVQQDSYTSPDGTVIYRKRVGKRTFCRRSGSGGGGSYASARGVNEAGWISCPSEAEWKRDP